MPMPPWSLTRDDIHYYADSHLPMRQLPSELVVTTDPSALSSLARDLWGAGDGRYTLTTLNTAAEHPAAVGVTLHVPAKFDPLTEVKTGGPIAYILFRPAEDGKWRFWMAVKDGYRRKGVGSYLMNFIRRSIPMPSTVVAPGNTGAMAFLGSLGWVVDSVSGRGLAFMEPYGQVEAGEEA